MKKIRGKKDNGKKEIIILCGGTLHDTQVSTCPLSMLAALPLMSQLDVFNGS